MKNFFYLLVAFSLVILVLLFDGCKKDGETPVDPPVDEISIGELIITPGGIFVNTSSQITARLIVPANVVLKDSSIKLIKLNSQNEPDGELGLLLDNGILLNGDEIIGDNVYSGVFSINQSTAGDLNLRASAVISNQNNASGNSNIIALKIFTDLTSQEFLQITSTQQSSTDQIIQYLNGSSDNIEAAMDQVTQWLQTQPAVQSATKEGTTSIEIKYKSGLYGGIIVSVENDNGTVETRGGIISKDERMKSRQIPIHKQTRGILNSPEFFNKVYAEGDCSDTTIIGNRNVLIYAPFEAAFAPFNEGTDVQNILLNSGYEFSITYLIDQAADISSLTRLTDYGYVVLATHGSGGHSFSTGEIVDTNSSSYIDNYKAMLKAGKLAIWTNMVIKKAGTVKTKKDVYAVRSPFISDLAGKFPQSVILNNSCESTKSNSLSDAFLSKGAKTYYGYSKVVNSGFCVTKAKELTEKLAKDLKNTGEAFIPGTDPTTPFAVYQMTGSNLMRYPESLINGDFECGNLFGWTKSGDGRVISRLASIEPTGGKYLGIISTGLGYTTATGSIFQTFKVPNDKSTLTLSWYFLSEEFLEFIGSQFQDYFKITLKVEGGGDVDLLYKSIDGLAGEFGARYNPPDDITAGNLISESPQVVFDRGGVFGTGWQSASFDVSAYRGKKITLILAAGDVGDSIYDTAILLDQCILQ